MIALVIPQPAADLRVAWNEFAYWTGAENPAVEILKGLPTGDGRLTGPATAAVISADTPAPDGPCAPDMYVHRGAIIWHDTDPIPAPTRKVIGFVNVSRPLPILDFVDDRFLIDRAGETRVPHVIRTNDTLTAVDYLDDVEAPTVTDITPELIGADWTPHRWAYRLTRCRAITPIDPPVYPVGETVVVPDNLPLKVGIY